MAGKDFEAFKKTIEQKFMGHPVVTRNDYTAWCARGDMPLDHMRRFTVQFSVFSNQFLLAALNRAVNAGTAHPARCGSATSSSGCTAATTTTKPWAPRSPWKTGRRPVSGKS